ncbi:transporter [Paraburkholderia nemoris]|uniref:SphA family protein n=1 Tax=Paraburkholderia nemoris TaxID=2793076 RepID=UPI0038B84F86
MKNDKAPIGAHPKSKEMVRMSWSRIVFAAVFALVSRGIWAAEGVNFGGPIGGTDIQNAYLPSQAGFYGAYIGGFGRGTTFYGNNGKENPNVSGGMTSGLQALGLLYVYPVTAFGGTLGTSVMGQAAWGSVNVNGVQQHYKGFGDMYSDLLMWSRHLGPEAATGFTVKLAYSMLFPVGKYNTTDLYTPGRNVYYYIPNAAVTYMTGPNFLGDGLELSAHFFLDIASRNNADQYENGTVADIDVAISERIGRWQVGVAGYYAWQLSDDHRLGQVVAPDGNRFESAAVGPVLSYDIPKWKSNIKLKVLVPVYTRNSLAATTAYFVLSKAFN